MPAKPGIRRQRDLNATFTLQRKSTGHEAYFVGGVDDLRLIPKTKGQTTKIVQLPDGRRVEDRRRWNPQVMGKFAHTPSITGTANELYLNDGPQARKGPPKKLKRIR